MNNTPRAIFYLCLGAVFAATVVCSAFALVLASTGSAAVLAIVLSLTGALVAAVPLFMFAAARHREILNLNRELQSANTELRRLNVLNEKRATIDAMTGLFNRIHFLNSTESRRKHDPEGSLLMIDADNFKYINDTFGHDVGDKALSSIAFAIAQAVRSEDIVGRVGGEEFAVYLPGTNPESAVIVAERIRKNVEGIRFAPNNQLHTLSVSIGAACTTSREAVASLLSRADRAMYHSKEGGRNQISIAAGAA